MTLANLRARLANPRPCLEAVGAFLVGRAQRAFAEQGRGGTQWSERAVPNRAGVLMDLRAGRQPPERRWDPRPAAVDTGRLRSSLAFRVEGTKVVVGSSLDYASDVQLGGAKVIELTSDMRAALSAWLRTLSNKAKGAKRANYPAAEARYQAARAAFGPLFHFGVLHVDVPPRPFLMVTDDDRRSIQGIVAGYLGGTSS